MINPQWLEPPISWTNFHGPRDARAIEVRLYCLIPLFKLRFNLNVNKLSLLSLWFLDVMVGTGEVLYCCLPAITPDILLPVTLFWHCCNQSKPFFLTLKMPSKIFSRRHSIFFYFFFSEKTRLDILCELPVMQTIHKKCQDLFSLKTSLDILCELSAFLWKQVLILYVNRLLSRQFTWNVKTCFLWKFKKISRQFTWNVKTCFLWKIKKKKIKKWIKNCRLLQLWLAIKEFMLRADPKSSLYLLGVLSMNLGINTIAFGFYNNRYSRD